MANHDGVLYVTVSGPGKPLAVALDFADRLKILGSTIDDMMTILWTSPRSQRGSVVRARRFAFGRPANAVLVVFLCRLVCCRAA